MLWHMCDYCTQFLMMVVINPDLGLLNLDTDIEGLLYVSLIVELLLQSGLVVVTAQEVKMRRIIHADVQLWQLMMLHVLGFVDLGLQCKQAGILFLVRLSYF